MESLINLESGDLQKCCREIDMSLMGIDIGTSGCKTAIYSEDGRTLASSYRAYRPIMAEPGRIEFDSRLVLDFILTTIREAVSIAAADPVRALSVGSFSEAVVPLSEKGEILGNSIAGSDNRNADSIGVFESMKNMDFYKINPNILSFTYTYPKLAWYRDYAPELYRSTHMFLNWSDYLVYYLTGIAKSTNSHANRTLLYDIDKENWSEELLEIGGINPRVLPDIVHGGLVLGTVKRNIAENLGLSKSVYVVSGGHDQCLNALGSGAIKGGQSATGIGTFECTTLVFDSIHDKTFMFKNNLNIEHHVVPGKYVSLIYNQAGSLLQWFLKVFAKELILNSDEESEVLSILTKEAPKVPTDLLFLPLLEPTGAPYFLKSSGGSFHGIKADSSRGDLYRALLEGETMYFGETIGKLADQGLPLKVLTASGGGSLSDLWLQIKADILGKEIRRSSHPDSGTLGAAILAGYSTGVYAHLDQALEIFEQDQISFSPNKEHYRFYSNQIRKFQDLFHQYT